MQSLIKLSCLLGITVCLSAGAFAATINVPADYSTIQGAINAAIQGDIIVISAGEYYENIAISQKHDIAIVGAGAENTIINGGGNGHVVVFNAANGSISGVTITNSGSNPLYSTGIFTSQCAILVDKCVVKGNNYGLKFSSNSTGIVCRSRIINNTNVGVSYSSSFGLAQDNIIANNYRKAIDCTDSAVDIINNTIVNNDFAAIYCSPADSMVILNNIISNHEYAVLSVGQDSIYSLDISYNNCYNNDNNYWYEWAIVCIPENPECSDGESGPFSPTPGDGEMNVNPLFADVINDDFHLKSEYGRWDTSSNQWIYDDVTSPCIDVGDPASDWTEELWPHGGRTNMGAYGGTPQASMSPNPIGNVADLDHDDAVDTNDLSLLSEDWLLTKYLLDTDLNRNGKVDIIDFAEFSKQWLWTEL